MNNKIAKADYYLKESGMNEDLRRRIINHCEVVFERNQGKVTQAMLFEIIAAFTAGRHDFAQQLLKLVPQLQDTIDEEEARKEGNTDKLLEIWKKTHK